MINFTAVVDALFKNPFATSPRPTNAKPLYFINFI